MADEHETTPAPGEIARFVEAFDKLAMFEAQCRHVRGWGAFGPETVLPIPEVVKVMAWLRSGAA